MSILGDIVSRIFRRSASPALAKIDCRSHKTSKTRQQSRCAEAARQGAALHRQYERFGVDESLAS